MTSESECGVTLAMTSESECGVTHWDCVILMLLFDHGVAAAAAAAAAAAGAAEATTAATYERSVPNAYLWNIWPEPFPHGRACDMAPVGDVPVAWASGMKFPPAVVDACNIPCDTKGEASVARVANSALTEPGSGSGTGHSTKSLLGEGIGVGRSL